MKLNKQQLINLIMEELKEVADNTPESVLIEKVIPLLEKAVAEFENYQGLQNKNLEPGGYLDAAQSKIAQVITNLRNRSASDIDASAMRGVKEAINEGGANPRKTPTKADNTIDARKLLDIIKRSTQNARKNPKLRQNEAFQQTIIPMHNHILRYVESNLAEIDKMSINKFYKVVEGAKFSYPAGQPSANFDAVMSTLINDEYGSMT